MPYKCMNPEVKLTNFKASNGEDAYVDNGHCARLVQVWCGAPQTASWQQGDLVKDATGIDAGTAIATFVNGSYPGADQGGRHAAIYLSHDNSGIQVIDQWVNRQGGTGKRKIRFNNTTGSNSNNGDVFYVIK